ncbi:MAG: hypothetical protein QOF13_2345 [Solirubrobacterales bacterium]|jgi:hypothetical protein|nr:hypothetical protein [Solirubrobacterales bacterium]
MGENGSGGQLAVVTGASSGTEFFERRVVEPGSARES